LAFVEYVRDWPNLKRPTVMQRERRHLTKGRTRK
jgi:hypothetical protein